MSEISDELREWAAAECNSLAHYKPADRIDAEMAEWPRGKDGRPIRVGETVYGEDGKAWNVEGVTIGEMSEATGYTICVKSDKSEWSHYKPDRLTHERPDSWERIADEIEKADVDGCTDWADRIRRLAEREEGR